MKTYMTRVDEMQKSGEHSDKAWYWLGFLDAQGQATRIAADADAEVKSLKGVLPGFSPMCLAPLDGTAVMLYMPTTTDKFAVGRWTDAHAGGWLDDEERYYTHQPAAFMALSNLSRLLGSHAIDAHLNGGEHGA